MTKDEQETAEQQYSVGWTPKGDEIMPEASAPVLEDNPHDFAPAFEAKAGKVEAPAAKPMTFKQKFAAERKNGAKEFEWNGKKYTTELAGQPKAAAKPAAVTAAPSTVKDAPAVVTEAPKTVEQSAPAKSRPAGQPVSNAIRDGIDAIGSATKPFDGDVEGQPASNFLRKVGRSIGNAFSSNKSDSAKALAPNRDRMLPEPFVAKQPQRLAPGQSARRDN